VSTRPAARGACSRQPAHSAKSRSVEPVQAGAEGGPLSLEHTSADGRWPL